MSDRMLLYVVFYAALVAISVAAGRHLRVEAKRLERPFDASFRTAFVLGGLNKDEKLRRFRRIMIATTFGMVALLGIGSSLID